MASKELKVARASKRTLNTFALRNPPSNVCSPFYIHLEVNPGGTIKLLMEFERKCVTPSGSKDTDPKVAEWTVTLTIFRKRAVDGKETWDDLVSLLYAPQKPGDANPVATAAKEGLSDDQSDALKDLSKKIKTLDPAKPLSADDITSLKSELATAFKS